jgi:hypothetical protein
MSIIIETRVFDFEELDDAARERAREWYRRLALDDDWYEFEFEQFETVCEILGITLRARPVRRMDGGTNTKPSIFFSGFSSQGDGACFEGSYRYVRSSARRIRQHAPNDKALHALADQLLAVQRRNFYQLTASMRQTGRYCHENRMIIGVQRDSSAGQDLSLADEDIVVETMRDLARWLYRRLEAEYDYQLADAQIDEALRASGHTFTDDGHRFG